MSDVRQSGAVVEVPDTTGLSAFVAAAVVSNEAVAADKDTPAHAGNVIGITDAATDMEAVSPKATIQTTGPLSNPAWDWTPNLPVFVGSNGALTQTRPTSGFVWPIALAVTATRLFVNPPAVAEVDKNYRHMQNTPATTWVVAHNLHKRPSITVVDSSGKEVYGEITHDSDDQATIRFTAGFSGAAYCN